MATKPKRAVANWLIGREIVEDQQQGKKRAGYGEVRPANSNAVRSKSESALTGMDEHIANAARAESPRSRLWDANSDAVRRNLVASGVALPIQHAVRDKSWRLGQLNS